MSNANNNHPYISIYVGLSAVLFITIVFIYIYVQYLILNKKYKRCVNKRLKNTQFQYELGQELPFILST